MEPTLQTSNERLKECKVKVVLRVRPLSRQETESGCQECLDICSSQNSEGLYHVDAGPKRFTFDEVFQGPSGTQKRVYEESVQPLVKSCLKGYNATVLAYGQTGSGKTFTMGTNGEDSDSSNSRGIIPRVVHDIFSGGDGDTTVSVSFLELYREKIRDLLAPLENQKAEMDDLTLREDTSGKVVVHGLRKVPVSGLESVMNILQQGSRFRTTGSTKMNATSSRSHAIFTLDVTSSKGGVVQHSQLHLVDLAGSERAKRTKAVGKQLKEATCINKGLLALGNVISALADVRKMNGGHVPFRNSKLTRLLQSSLGGNSQTVMIACASPADINLDETMNTLKYANRARKITNKPVLNEQQSSASDPQAVLKLKSVISRLQLQLSQQNSSEVLMLRKRIGELESTLSKARDCISFARLDDDESKHEGESNNKHGSLWKSVMETLASGVEAPLVHAANLPTLPGVEGTSSPDQSTVHDAAKDDEQQFDSRRHEMIQELEAIDRTLEAKSKTALALANNQESIGELCQSYQETVDQLSKQIEKLEHERQSLKKRLKHSDQAPQLRQLEQQITKLKKEQADQAKLLRVQERSLRGANRLKDEITSLKHAKVQLVRRIKTETDEFQKWKKQQSNNMKQMKKKEMKQKYEYMKLERQHHKQELVLKRRTEQVAAIQKRLKSALESRRQQNKMKKAVPNTTSNSLNGVPRNGNQNVPSTTVQDMQSSTTPPWNGQIHTWLMNQVDIECSTNEAREALSKEYEIQRELATKARTIEDTVENAGQIANLKKEQAECEQRISSLQELMQAVTGDENSFSKSEDQKRRGMKRWLAVRTTREGKRLLGEMFDLFVQTKLDLQRGLDRSQSESKMLKDTCTDIRKEMLRIQEESSQIQSESEEKILTLMKQLKHVGRASEGLADSSSSAEAVVAAMKTQMEIQQDEIERLSMMQSELALVRQERDLLKQEIEELNSSTPQAAKEVEKVIKKVEPKKPMKSRGRADSESEEEEWWDESESDDMVEIMDSDSDWEEDSSSRQRKQSTRNSTSRKSSSSTKNSLLGHQVDVEVLKGELPKDVVSRVEGMKKVELQQCLRYLELAVTGRKDALQSRVLSGLYGRMLQLRAERGSDESEIPAKVLLPAMEVSSESTSETKASDEQIKEKKSESRVSPEDLPVSRSDTSDITRNTAVKKPSVKMDIHKVQRDRNVDKENQSSFSKGNKVPHSSNKAVHGKGTKQFGLTVNQSRRPGTSQRHPFSNVNSFRQNKLNQTQNMPLGGRQTIPRTAGLPFQVTTDSKR